MTTDSIMRVNVRTTAVCFAFQWFIRRMLQSRLRRDWQGSRGRDHHNPIPSARGEPRGVCQWVAGHSSSGSSTSSLMIRAAYVVHADCLVHVTHGKPNPEAIFCALFRSFMIFLFYKIISRTSAVSYFIPGKFYVLDEK